MSRQAQQVHIYLYRENVNNENEFAIFQRSDNALWWQGITGGVEEGESLEEAARREIYEEAGIREEEPLYQLESISYLPVYLFDESIQKLWGKNTVVIPMYFFAMPYRGKIILSYEHTQYKWLSYNEAEKLVYFHDQKTALWELQERLVRGKLY